ncbi:MAG: oligosaccharide flippase family protein [Thiotrichaceae bacterium]|nr:oligosaccharide flippase family protein [Thiotrichaceae bacterium]
MPADKNLKLALLFSAIGQYSIQIVAFVTIMILARLLSPDEIGVYAVAGTASILATQLSSFGVIQYLIREKDIHENKIRSVLGMAIIVSWGLGILLIVFAPDIAVFYEKPAIKTLLWILSISFFVVPFFSVPIALWKRKMQFHQIAIMSFTGQLVTSVSTVSLVLLDFSYYGLALGVIVGLFSRLLITVFFKPPGTVWIPKFTLVRDLLKFGFFTSLTNVFARLSEGIPDLVIGKVGSMADVGYFSRGFGAVLFLNKILISAVVPVVLPHLAGVKHSGGSVAGAYLKSVKLLLAFTLPAFAVAGAAAYPMIIGLFGNQWGAAVPITSILAVWVMFISVHSFSSSAFIVAGDEKLMFTSGLIITVFRLALVLTAASQGLEMVAWAMVASGVVEFIVNTLALKKSIGLKINKMIIVLLPNLFIAFACWLSTTLIDQIIVFEDANPIESLVIVAISSLIIWLFMLRVTKHEAWYLIWDILRKIKR